MKCGRLTAYRRDGKPICLSCGYIRADDGRELSFVPGDRRPCEFVSASINPWLDSQPSARRES